MSSIASSEFTSVSGASRATNRGRIARVSLATVVAATAANVFVYYLGGAFVAYDPQFLPLANVSGAIIFTVVPAIVAVLLYAALLRFTRHPARIFMVIAAVVFVVTLMPDFTYTPTLPGATGAQIVTLVLMHLVAAGVIVGMLTRLARPRG